jgi:hypothetical protein
MVIGLLFEEEMVIGLHLEEEMVVYILLEEEMVEDYFPQYINLNNKTNRYPSTSQVG